jgi:hypothetical protein
MRSRPYRSGRSRGIRCSTSPRSSCTSPSCSSRCACMHADCPPHLHADYTSPSCSSRTPSLRTSSTQASIRPNRSIAAPTAARATVTAAQAAATAAQAAATAATAARAAATVTAARAAASASVTAARTAIAIHSSGAGRARGDDGTSPSRCSRDAVEMQHATVNWGGAAAAVAKREADASCARFRIQLS